MSNTNRREFFRNSAALAAGLGVAVSSAGSAATPTFPVAVVARGRLGERMATQFARHPEVRLAALAGVRGRSKAPANLANWKRSASHFLSDPSLRAIALSVPGRWSLRFAFAALEGGKDVYLDALRGYAAADLAELAAVARKHHRVVQVAIPHRANAGVREAMEAVRAGAVGSVRIVRTLCLRAMGDNADEFGSAGWSARVVRATDLGVWAMGDAAPRGVLVAGFDSMPRRAAAFPDTTVAAFNYGERLLVVEQSAIAGTLPDGIANGVIVEGNAGRLVCDGESATLFAPDGSVTQRFSGKPDPVGEFVRALHAGAGTTPAWSGPAAVQLAADAYREGEDTTFDAVQVAMPPLAAAALQSLRARAGETSQQSLALGSLAFRGIPATRS